DCLDEGGGAPLIPPQAPQVGIGELLFSVRVLPQTSSFELDSGAVAVIVTATNPSDSPVWVAIAARTFAVTFQPVGGGESFQQVVGASASRIGFEAGLSRHQVFDFVLPPGLYTVEASFSRTAVAGTEYQVD